MKFVWNDSKSISMVDGYSIKLIEYYLYGKKVCQLTKISY